MPKDIIIDKSFQSAFEYCGKSDAGKIRTNNEDSFVIDENLGLFVLCDGMGGHNSGELASHMAVELISSNFKRAIEKSFDKDSTQVMFGERNPKLSESANQLVSSIRIANNIIYERANASPENAGMGTTVVALLARKNSYVVAWVGDSRIYIVKHNRIQALTSDHTLVQEQINKGMITAEEAEKSDFKNVLTRALGAENTVQVDCQELPAFSGDYLLMCSDGLSKMINDEQLYQIIRKFRNPVEICEKLIETANDRGGRDNVTAIVIRQKAETLLGRIFAKIANLRP